MHRSLKIVVAAILVGSFSLSVPRIARADTESDRKAKATKLYGEAQDDLRANRIEPGCLKVLKASFLLQNEKDILIDAVDCGTKLAPEKEKAGDFGAAYDWYSVVATFAPQAGKPAAATSASEKKAALESRTVKVTLRPKGTTTANDLTVTVDGRETVFDPDAPVFHVTAGAKHHFEVSSPGLPTKAIDVPAASAPFDLEGPQPVSTGGPALPPPEEKTVWAGHRIGPWVVGGIGVAALIGGAVTGGLVVHAHSVQDAQCNDSATASKKFGTQTILPHTCTTDGAAAESQGHSLGPATTVLLAGGGTLVAAGVIWLVAAPHETKPSTTSIVVAPAISSDQKGIVVVGAF
jgi:hypothetical protein